VRSRGPLSCQWSPRGDAHSEWQRRWDAAFTPDNGFWSGNLPTLDLGGEAQGAAVARVFYMAALTVISQMRTNLPIIFARAFPNGNGNVGHSNMGIGGSRSWWWDEALSSMLLSLLEPDGRAPTFEAWLDHDSHPGTTFGHGMGNGYAMDCEPKGSGTFGQKIECIRPVAAAAVAMHDSSVAATAPRAGPEYGFYCCKGIGMPPFAPRARISKPRTRGGSGGAGCLDLQTGATRRPPAGHFCSLARCFPWGLPSPLAPSQTTRGRTTWR